MTDKIPITVVIPVKNEELGLPRCLLPLSRFAEILVVDSGSSDRTQQIARAAGAKVELFRWNGCFPKKRNWTLLNYEFTTAWVLFLDADEIVTERFCLAAASAIRNPSYNGYWLTYQNYFSGKKLRHGVPQRKLALFRVGAGLYERIDEARWSALDMEVHEHPVIVGKVGRIKEPIGHKDFRGLEHFLKRHIEYAKWEARRLIALAPNNSSHEHILTLRQRIKYSYLGIWWYPSVYFLYTYVIRGGFLDGGAGLQYALYKFWYFQTIRGFVMEDRKLANASNAKEEEHV